MKDEELKGFPTEEQIDFVIDLKRKITLEKGFCTDADIYLAGLKAGRPQWHDLRKDPEDLPDDTYDVLDQAGYKVHYNFFQNVWMNEKDEIDEHVIAWCEIPTFDKE